MSIDQNNFKHTVLKVHQAILISFFFLIKHYHCIIYKFFLQIIVVPELFIVFVVVVVIVVVLIILPLSNSLVLLSVSFSSLEPLTTSK